ncbi:MAG TPA: hypothetical protein VGL83_15910 [Stellaceae bacterium]|jgi:hypothetical protein
MLRMLTLALLFATAACASTSQTAVVTPGMAPAPAYERPQDAQLPIDQQTAVLQGAETGCAQETQTAEDAALPPIPGDPSAAVHRQLALQNSPGNTVVGDPAFDACMHSLGYDRIR